MTTLTDSITGNVTVQGFNNLNLLGTTFISYDFSNQLSNYYSPSENFIWNSYEISQFEDAMEQWENVANIAFVPLADAPTNLANFTYYTLTTSVFNELFPGTSSSILGRMTFPDANGNSQGGWFNWEASGWAEDNYAGLSQGGYGYLTILHEVGHGLGLAHPHDTGSGSTIMPGVVNDDSLGDGNHNQGINTLMSYNDGIPADELDEIAYGWTGTPMAFDIAAIQDLYGANLSYANGNNTYYLPSSNGSGTFYEAIWDTGGIDVIRAQGNGDATINLNAATLGYGDYYAGGGLSRVDNIHGGFTIANGVLIEDAVGSYGNDNITGNDSANNLTGGGGNDSISAGGGNDTMHFYQLSGVGTEYVNGGSGYDRIELHASADTAYSFNNSSFRSIEEIQFSSGWSGAPDNVDISAFFNANQFNLGPENSVRFALNLHIDGTAQVGSTEAIYISMGQSTSLDISQWTFQDWGDEGEIISIYGDEDSETITGSSQDDYINGAGGFDRVSYMAATTDLTIDLTAGTAVSATTGSDILDNIENITAGFGNDNVSGNDQNNAFLGGAGNDRLYGLAGDDYLNGDSGNDRVDGGAGNDYLAGGTGEDILYGQQGDDILYGGSHDDYLFGHQGNDLLVGEAGSDHISGGIGHDQLYGGDGIDYLSGGLGNDLLNGQDGDDVISGGENGDQLFGHTGNDTLNGDGASDIIKGHTGNDILSGGLGADYLFGEADDDLLNGDAGNDTLLGGTGNDTLFGNQDNDILFGQSGEDTLNGGQGNDFLYGGADNDTLLGGSGNDLLFGQDGNDSIRGGEGFDQLFGGHGHDEIFGEDGDDLINGQDGNDIIHGDNGNDTLYGHIGDDTIFGDAGDDLIDGQSGNDTLDGGDGTDRISGGAGQDYLNGGLGNDLLFGGIGNDSIFGSSGVDQLYGQDGDDILGGGAGNDNLFGGLGADTLNGNAGDDLLLGFFGNDFLFGSSGDDQLYGQYGNDLIAGGIGNDTLSGGGDNDTFVFGNNFGIDVILDFSTLGSDYINLGAVTGITDFSDLVNNHVAVNGIGDIVIYDNGSTLTINNYGMSDMESADFLF